MKRILLFIALLTMAVSYSQTALDTLLQQLTREKNDDTRIDLLVAFLGSTSETDPVLDLKNTQAILVDAQKRNDRIIEAAAFSQMGYDYRAFGNYPKSLEYCIKADALARETGNIKLIANTEVTLAHIYKDRTDFQKAIPMYYSTLENGRITKDNLLQLWAYISLAQCYLEVNQPDSALMYGQRAYELAKIHAPYMLSSIFSRLGLVHGNMGNPMLAITYFHMAIEAADSSSSPRWRNEAYYLLGEYYFQKGQTDSSIFYNRKAIEVVANTAFSTKSIKPAKRLLDIFENRNSDSAIRYLKLYNASNDSLFSARATQQTQAMILEDELRQEQLKVDAVRAEDRRRINLQYVILAIGIVTIIIIYLLISRSVIVHHRLVEFFGVIALLIVFEFLNLLLHPFLERITNHSPLLMLGALVCIAALLVPLHHRLQRWATRVLVEKNKKIRLESAKRTIKELEEN